MNFQITLFELMNNPPVKEDQIDKPEDLPVAAPGERVLTIPGNVWETRCVHCVHKNAEKNVPVPAWAAFKYRYDKILPCRIMGICRANDRPGECMSFAPRSDCSGICATCEHNNPFFDGFCTKADHAPERRVFYWMDYGGDARNVDYWGRHALSVCDDYEPNEFVRRKRNHE